MIVQGKCRSVHSNNKKGDHDRDEVFSELRVYFDVLVRRNKVFSESSHCIETYIDVVVEVLEVHISAAFEFCLG